MGQVVQEVPGQQHPMREMPTDVCWGKVPSTCTLRQGCWSQAAWGSQPLRMRAPSNPLQGSCPQEGALWGQPLGEAENTCTRTRAETHTAGDMEGTHQKQEEKLLLPATLPQNPLLTKLNILLTQKKFLKGSAPLSQMDNEWIWAKRQWTGNWTRIPLWLFSFCIHSSTHIWDLYNNDATLYFHLRRCCYLSKWRHSHPSPNKETRSQKWYCMHYWLH